ncbi:MAG: DEAD/DEAH box helicase [Bacteroidetes bacterium]|nr:DEAD/DEAH box helicase [Bacteroidota bacterium]
MIALHFALLDNEPCLWIEQGRRTALDAKGKETVLRRHGFVATMAPLAEGLEMALSGTETARRDCLKCTAWLPGTERNPLPSSPLLGEIPARESPLTLRPVPVMLRRTPLEELFQFCALATTESDRPPGVLFAASLHWAAQVQRFALDLVRRGRLLPDLIQDQGVWYSRWRVALDARDHETRRALETAMPAVVRCLGKSKDSPPSVSPGTLLDVLLGALVNWLLRDPLDLGEGEAPRRRGRPASVHGAWLEALTAKEAVVRWADDTTLANFAAELERWRRPLELSTMSPFVFGFRLREPETEGDRIDWYLEFLVRPRDDPGLRLSLQRVWKSKSKEARRLQSFGPQLTEFLHVAPAQAAALYPTLKQALKTARPVGMSLDGDGVVAFLRDHAALLEQSGFDVLYPAWWSRRGAKRRVALHASVSSPETDAPSAFSLDALLDFDITASIGDERLALEDLHALAELKSPLVLMRGQWTFIDQDDIRSAIARLQQHGSGKITARDALRLSLGGAAPVDGLRLEGAELHGWIADLASRLSGAERMETLEAPEGFEGTLRPYQQRGYSWMAFLRQWGFGACLADDMGLGKTVQTLAMLDRERARGEKRPVLLVCPTTVVTNWLREAERFTPALRVLVHHGTGRHRDRAFLNEAKRSHLVVSSYGLLHRDAEQLGRIDWAGVILDEAQNIKNPETKQSRAARALPAEYRLALTGTPVENSVADLWALMEFLNPGLLGSHNAFRNRYQIPIQKWGDEHAARQLRGVTAPFILRREKTDRSIISDLPDKIVQKEFCSLTKEQASLYAAVVRNLEEGLAEKEGMERRGLILTALMRLKQVCNHPAQFLGDGSEWRGRSGKLRRLQDIVGEVRRGGEHVLVFTQFMEMGLLLQQALQEQLAEEVFFIHGGVPRRKRDDMVERFQKDERAPTVFVLSVKAGGTGLTLTRANHVVHFDRWWNPAVENQATDRAFRIGQKRNVFVHTFIVPGTLEERIDAVLERKREIADSVVGSGEQWLTELSDGRLLDLVRLGADATGEDE